MANIGEPLKEVEVVPITIPNTVPEEIPTESPVETPERELEPA